MALLVSDDIGLIKTVSSELSVEAIISHESGVGLAVTGMCWLNASCSSVSVSRANGVIDFFELKDCVWTKSKTIDTDSVITSMSLVNEETLVVVTEGSILRYSSMEYHQLSCDTLPEGPYTVSNVVNDERAILASGGDPPILIDLKSLAVVWKGRNAADTPLGLKSRFTCETFVAFTPTLFVSGSAEGKLRLYDTDRQRKPILELALHDAYRLSGNYTGATGQCRPIKVLTLSEDRSTLLVGDTFGSVMGINVDKVINSPVKSEEKPGTKAHFDWARRLLPLRFSVSGIMGSVRCIQIEGDLVYIATAGRYLYAYNPKNKRVLKQSFGQKLTYCLPSKENSPNKRPRTS
jgi:hypothetical protein